MRCAWRAGLAAALLALAAGCAVPPPAPVDATDPLLDDAAFGTPTEPPDASRLFVLSPAMQRYVDEVLLPAARRVGRQRALADALQRPDALQLLYDPARTLPAADTFAIRRGNCLSLVILTAALAKSMDLTVDYRAADIDDSFSRRGDLVLASGHVNITIGRRVLERGLAGDNRAYTVDFLPPAELQGLRSHRIGEHELLAMYLNNRAAEALAAGRLDDAYAWAAAAVRRDPSRVASINTLGAIYRQRGLLPQAVRAFRHVLALSPSHVPAVANLASALQAQGEVAEAALWRARLATLEAHAPFEEHDAGRRALALGDYRSAVDWFRRALARAPEEADSHYWLGLALYYDGQRREAFEQLRESVARTQGQAERQARYAAKIDWLREHAARP